jgi:hypothetical protein
MINLSDDKRGLLRAAVGEALGGFAAGRFSVNDRANVVACWQRIEESSPMPLTTDDVSLLVRVLQFSLNELGAEEFQTITGNDFEFGVAVLNALQEEDVSTKCKTRN